MTHYVKVLDKKVVKGIVAEESFFNSFVDNTPGTWVQTSYNTRGGQHLNGDTPLRKNYAGLGDNYDGVGFYKPQPYPSWILNETTYLWEPPTSMPTDGGAYQWNESTESWDELDD